jgi:hypothetical protein
MKPTVGRAVAPQPPRYETELIDVWTHVKERHGQAY